MTTLDQLEALADQAQYEYDNAINIAEGDIAFYDLFIAAANPATIKSLVALCRLQNQAIHELRTVINMMLEDRNGKCFTYVGPQVCDNEALAAYERFNGGAE